MDLNKNLYNDTRENLLFITIMILSILSYWKGQVFSIISIFWIIHILFSGNVKRVYSRQNPQIIMIIRRLLYIIPLLFPMIMGFKFNLTPKNFNIYLYIIIGILIGIMFTIPKIKTWQLYLSYDMIAFTHKKTKLNYLSMIILLILTPICEEYFYRNFIIANTKSILGLISIILSAYLFFMHHFKTKWSDTFSKHDFIVQFLFGLITGLIFYYSESIIPCISAHLTYNCMSILLEFKTYIYHYVKTSNEHSCS